MVTDLSRAVSRIRPVDRLTQPLGARRQLGVQLVVGGVSLGRCMVAGVRD
jgi:hypothetical protein